MLVDSLKYNPFALNTAKAAWEDRERSIPSRAINTVAGALKDIYIKNPYDLTAGNAQYAFSSPELRTRSEKVAAAAIICIGSLYTLVLYGATVNFAGKGITELGSRMGLQFLSKGGQTAQRISEMVFLAGAIPLYGAFYALPKITMEHVPKWIEFTGKKIQRTTQWIFENVLTPFWIHAMQPALQTIDHTLEWVKNFIGSAAQIAFQKIAEYSTWVLENCLQPAWSRVIEPIFNVMNQAIQFTSEKTAQLTRWVLQNILIPVQDRFIEPLGQILSKVFRVIGTTLDNAIQSAVRRSIECIMWIFDKAIKPCFDRIAGAASKVGNALLDYVILPIGKKISMIVKKVAVYAHLIFDKVIAPLGRAVRDGFSFAWDVVQQKTYDLFERVASSWAKVASFFGT